MPADDRSPARPSLRVRGRDRRVVTPQPPPAGVRPAVHAWRPARFLVSAAHPDDAEYGPAATAAAWIDAGSTGRLVCCTSGDQGGEDPHADPLVLAATREEEQRRAAAIVGYDEVVFLHQPDGALANELPLRELLVREIRRFRPDAVLTHDPEVLFYSGAGVNHSDHRAAGIAAVDAVFPAARNPMAFPSLARAGLAAHAVRRLYLFWPNAPTAWVDVAGTLDRKIAALRCHASQVADPEDLEARIRAWAAEEGEPIGAAAAESFRVIVIDDDPAEGPHEAGAG
jgi:LmbE family N-acetylglucosaminyl deacetylase